MRSWRGAFFSSSTRRRGRRWHKSVTACVLAAVGCTALLLPGAPPAGASLLGTQTVIVTSTGLLSPLSVVASLGGSVLRSYGVIDGVEAKVSSLLLPVLEALPGITVTPDLQVSVQGDAGDTSTQPAAVYPEQTGATTLAADGDTGSGVTVAVLDTGIDDLPDFAGRLIGGVDLTGGGNPFNDQYGHGTFVAGLIAGDGASSGGEYVGEAPGADLVSIKVAGASGVTDLATVIAGVDWAVLNEATYHIKVLNMSLGFQPITSTVLNPLDQAVELAWDAGITVVTSAGNAGPFNGTILSPGDDPLVITVGAVNDLGQYNPADDQMSAFSSVGPTTPDGWVKPDLTAPGAHVISLAAPGSTIYDENPSARIGSGNFVGSGTSFSAAVTSGAAALVLADNPTATPDQVKARLLGTTVPGPVGNPFVDGHGILDAYAAASSPTMDYHQSTLGEVAAALNAVVPLTDARLVDTWNASLWTGAQWGGAQWGGAQWGGAQWGGAAWNGFAWNGYAWDAANWTGAQWGGAQWAGSAWNGAQWGGSAWAGAQWGGAAWDGSSWS